MLPEWEVEGTIRKIFPTQKTKRQENLERRNTCRKTEREKRQDSVKKRRWKRRYERE
jgi:hypothetical protein